MKRTDIHGIEVKVGDRIKGVSTSAFRKPLLVCNGGFSIDLSPVVTVIEKDGILFGGALSLSSFRKFEIIKTLEK